VIGIKVGSGVGVAVGVAVNVFVGVGVLVGVGVAVDVGVAVGVNVGVGVAVGVFVGVGVTVGVGVAVGVMVGVGVGNSRIRALKEWIFPQEETQLELKLRGPSFVTNSFRMRLHPHAGNVHRLRRYRESALTAYVKPPCLMT